MTRVTIKTAAIRGVISLYANPQNPRLFLAEGCSYKPMEFEANTLGEAVDTFLQNVHRLQRSDDAIAKGKARGIKIAAARLANQDKDKGKPQTQLPIKQKPAVNAS